MVKTINDNRPVSRSSRNLIHMPKTSAVKKTAKAVPQNTATTISRVGLSDDDRPVGQDLRVRLLLNPASNILYRVLHSSVQHELIRSNPARNSATTRSCLPLVRGGMGEVWPYKILNGDRSTNVTGLTWQYIESEQNAITRKVFDKLDQQC